MAKTLEKLTNTGSDGGLVRLAAEVIDRDRCTICGACVGNCPYFVYHRGRVKLLDRCNLTQGRCYDFCPMAGARGEFEGDLGQARKVFIAQADNSDILKAAQYGGVVSALVALALSQGLVQEAILTRGDPEGPPRGVRARTRPEVLSSAGSRYAASGVVATLNEALADGSQSSLALVGTPCQIKAAAAMRQASGVSYDPGRIKLLLGLFCTWAVDYRRLSAYLRLMLFGERPLGYDIPPPPADVFKVNTDDGIKAFPLNEIRPMRLNACNYCDDLTSTGPTSPWAPLKAWKPGTQSSSGQTWGRNCSNWLRTGNC